MATKTVIALSDPFIVEPNVDYWAGGSVMATANGVATYADDILWYDGLGDGTPDEASLAPSSVAAGSATTNFGDNVWTRIKVTAPQSAKYARRRHTGVIVSGRGYRLIWAPPTFEPVPIVSFVGAAKWGVD